VLQAHVLRLPGASLQYLTVGWREKYLGTSLATLHARESCGDNLSLSQLGYPEELFKLLTASPEVFQNSLLALLFVCPGCIAMDNRILSPSCSKQTSRASW